MEHFGGAGHSLKIAECLSEKGRLIGIDRDVEAINKAKEVLKEFKNVTYVQENHDNIKQIIEALGIKEIDGILLDLGVSSYQLDEETRGFSYKQEAKLDMRMNQEQELTAKTIINTYSEEKLAKIIYEYGEEKFSRQIARKIDEQRKKKEIETTLELVNIIEKVVPRTKNAGHPAKRTFQAIRIEVNNEIKPLYHTILNAIECLKSQGRLCVITFHSLEDRAVKQAFIDAVRKVHLSTRFTILCLWKKKFRNNNNEKTNFT